jgi:pyruvate kinase
MAAASEEGRMSRRVRIVCTLGPATATDEGMRALVDAGMDVARLNFSHGTHDAHAAMIERVRRASEGRDRPVAVLADLQGPKIRLGRFQGGAAVLAPGAVIELVAGADLEGDATRASTTYEAFARDVRAGDTVLVDDGRVRLEVLDTDGTRARCRAPEGGTLSDHKGLNLPGVAVSAPALSDKDADDLRFALAHGVDLVALSFVRSPADADDARRVMEAAGVRLPLLAKLEKPEAVAALESVLDAFDGVMVARGDLGVEMPLEQVPLVQKRALRLARERAKPAIVATQMLESMIDHERPTRAEVSDVANAVLDGADAVMLSGETSVGRDPAHVVSTMSRIAVAAEREGICLGAPAAPHTGDTAAVAAAAVQAAADSGATALVSFTATGSTARLLSAHRPSMPLYAFTPDEGVRRRLALTWGVEPFVVAHAPDTDTMMRQVDRALIERGLASPGDRVVVVAGTPPGVPGSTNTIRLHHIWGA